MHHEHPAYTAMVAKERFKDFLREAEQDRLVAQLPKRRSALHQIAHQIGRCLIWMGTRLTRFGHMPVCEQTLIEV